MKIYISATYRDLQRHRAAVAKVLRRMGHEVVGMEEYVAEGARPLQHCLDDLARCDVYVGIFAWRYGSVPADGDGVSITECELRHAEGRPMPVLLFLLDGSAEWPSHQYDAVTGEGEQGKRIADLRRRLEEQYLVSHFASADELASLVSAAVHVEEMKRRLSFEKLIEAPEVDEHFTREYGVSISSLINITAAISGPDDVQVLRIDLGDGTRWWMTRLYFLASLAADLTSIEVLVFLTGDAFAGTASARVVKERLAALFPELQPYAGALAASGRPHGVLSDEVHRRAEIWNATMLAHEKAGPVFVTRAELRRWLAASLVEASVDTASGDSSAQQVQSILDYGLRFVPMTEHGTYRRVVDRQALATEIARMFVREQLSRR